MTDPDLAEQVTDLFPLDGPYDPDHTTGAAEAIAGLVRYLNHATAPWKSGDCLPFPSHLARTVAYLSGAMSGLDQLLHQLTLHCDRFADTPGLYDDHGGDPRATAGNAAGALEVARAALGEVAGALSRAHTAANRLGVRD